MRLLSVVTKSQSDVTKQMYSESLGLFTDRVGSSTLPTGQILPLFLPYTSGDILNRHIVGSIIKCYNLDF